MSFSIQQSRDRSFPFFRNFYIELNPKEIRKGLPQVIFESHFLVMIQKITIRVV